MAGIVCSAESGAEKVRMLDNGFYCMDCMDGMRQFPDKHFDLAIVDPPYGDGTGDVAHNNILRGGGGSMEPRERKVRRLVRPVQYYGSTMHTAAGSRGIRSTRQRSNANLRGGGVELDVTSSREIRRTVPEVQQRRVTRTGGAWARKYAGSGYL